MIEGNLLPRYETVLTGPAPEFQIVTRPRTTPEFTLF